MKSNTVRIDNHGNGFRDVVAEAGKVAVYEGMKPEDFNHMRLLIEEMLSMLQLAGGDLGASFWIECEDGMYNLHLNTKTDLNKEQRYHLLSTATSGKNESANTFRGALRDRFEQAMASDVDHDYDELPSDLLSDLPVSTVRDPEWDGYERKILKNVADSVKIGILRGVVDVVVSRKYTRPDSGTGEDYAVH